MRYLRSAFVLVVLLGVDATSSSAQQAREVSAQTGSAPDTERGPGNWGWLGLLGLAGLAGMKRRDTHSSHTIRSDAHPSTSR